MAELDDDDDGWSHYKPEPPRNRLRELELRVDELHADIDRLHNYIAELERIPAVAAMLHAVDQCTDA